MNCVTYQIAFLKTTRLKVYSTAHFHYQIQYGYYKRLFLWSHVVFRDFSDSSEDRDSIPHRNVGIFWQAYTAQSGNLKCQTHFKGDERVFPMHTATFVINITLTSQQKFLRHWKVI